MWSDGHHRGIEGIDLWSVVWLEKGRGTRTGGDLRLNTSRYIVAGIF